MVSIVVVNYNDYLTTSNFICKIKNYECIDHIVVVDNESPDGSYEKLLSFSTRKIDIIKSGKNGGYGYGNNVGIRFLNERYGSDICIISNPDVEFDESVVLKLEKILRNDIGIAIVAPIMTKPQGDYCVDTAWKIPTGWQYVFSTCRYPLNKFSHTILYSVEELSSGRQLCVGAVAGSMFMIRVSDFMQVGGYDENIFLYGEENVMGIKLSRLNKLTVLKTDDKFIHRHSVSIDKSISSRKQRQLIIKSRMYVLEQYYCFKTIELFAAKLLINLSDIVAVPVNKVAKIAKKFL